MARVFVAMSGGVDSSVAAALLVRDGHDVTGVTMRLLSDESPLDGCCSREGVWSAKRVCDAIGIPHYTLDFAAEFARDVIEPYCDQYAAGRTPNPCIACNDRIKFSELLRRVSLQNADYLATGHYARISEGPDAALWLERGVDATKDQSYFLYRMTAPQLAHTLFPLGGLEKTRVRELAREFGLPTAERPESQETCFVPDGNVRGFVRERRPESFVAGPIVDTAGVPVGEHDGVPGMTIGQRRGLALGGPERRFVTRIDPGTATVTVGGKDTLSTREVRARDVVWRGPANGVRVTARVRYRGPEPSGTAEVSNGVLTVRFDEPVDAPAPGQAIVCYDGARVVGGGVIGESA